MDKSVVESDTDGKNVVRAIILIGITLIFCNLAFISSSGWAKLAWTIVGYVGLILSYKLARLRPNDVGLSRTNIKSGLRYGLVASLVILGLFLLVFFIDNQIFKDPRYNTALPDALYAALILLPLKTVLFEELAFRGILPALIIKFRSSKKLATIVSSVAFGLWHVSTSYSLGNYEIGGEFVVPKLFVMVGIVAITAVVGAFLCELRWRSKSLVAPIMVHWFVNGFAMILAALSWS